jgi:hypothetical protein
MNDITNKLVKELKREIKWKTFRSRLRELDCL